MEEPPNNTSEATEHDPFRIFLSLSHIWRFVIRSYRKILLITLLLTLITTGFALTRPIRYSVSATFQAPENTESRIGIHSGSLSFDSNTANEEEEHLSPISLMRSRKLLEPLIQNLNLQVSITTPNNRWLRLAKDNLRVELAYLLGNGRLILDEQSPELHISAITYTREVTRKYLLEFQDDHTFILKDKDNHLISHGRTETPFSCDQVSFTLHGIGKPGQRLLLTFFPLHDVAKALKKQIHIAQDITDSSLFHLHLSHFTGDRHLAARIVNQLMEEYQNYLQKEARQEAAEKLAYLEKRQQEMLQSMESFLQHNEPAFSYETQSTLLNKRQEDYQRKLSSLTRQMKSLEAFEKQSHNHSLSPHTLQDFPSLQTLLEDIRKYKQQRDLFDLELYPDSQDESPPPNKTIAELERVKRKVRDLDLLASTLTADPLVDYLQDLRRRYAIQSSVLESRLLYQTPSQHASESNVNTLDLDTASRLFTESNTHLEDLQKQIQANISIIDHIDDPDFVLSSLSGRLEDPVSSTLIAEASEIADRVANEAYYTKREINYFTAFLARKKALLKNHITQKLRSQREEVTQLITKIRSLQASMLDLISQELAVRENQLKETVSTKREALAYDHSLLTEQLQEVENQLAQLPEKWAAERELKMRADLNSQITKSLSEMVEAINISHHIESIKTAPLEKAIPPPAPDYPKIFKFLLFGLIWGLTISSFLLLLTQIATGFTTTPEALAAAGCHVSGTLGLDSLRRVLSFFLTKKGPPHLLLATGEGPDYSADLARLLHLKGHSVLIIHTPTGLAETTSDDNGLLQHLQGNSDTPHIEHQDYFDLIASGGTTPYVTELIDSKKFKLLLTHLDALYDWILIVNQSHLASAEAENMLSMASHIVVTVTHEKFHSLQPYISLARQKQKSGQITFIKA